MRNPTTFVFTVLLVLFGALPASAGERLFPLESGNFWIYQTADGKHRLELYSTLPVMSNDRAYNYVRGYLAERHLMREEPGVGLYFFDEEASAERLVTSFDPVGRPVFPAEHRPCGTVTGTVVAGRQGRGTPTGYWPDALRINYQTASCGEAAVESEYFVAGIGMVERTVRLNGEALVFQLVSARVGKVLVMSNQSSMTWLTLFSQKQGDTALRLLLQVVATVGNEATITFPTTQRYDVVIRNEQGQKFWQYSDGKTFPEMYSTVTGGIDIDIEIPLSALPGRTIAPGLYTVEAWLVTAPLTSSFAASAQVTIDDFGQPPAGGSARLRSPSRPGLPRPLPGRPYRY